MQKGIQVLLVILLNINPCIGQWNFGTKGNDFDGKYKYAYVTGSSNDRIYDSPTLHINYFTGKEKWNIYLSGIGYLGCDSKNIKYTFDGGKVENVSSWNLSTDQDRESLFLNDMGDPLSFIERIKKGRKLSVRYSSDCETKMDVTFSLTGSAKAVEYVLSDVITRIKNEKEAEDRRVKNEKEAAELAYKAKRRDVEIFQSGHRKSFEKLDSAIIADSIERHNLHAYNLYSMFGSRVSNEEALQNMLDLSEVDPTAIKECYKFISLEYSEKAIFLIPNKYKTLKELFEAKPEKTKPKPVTEPSKKSPTQKTTDAKSTVQFTALPEPNRKFPELDLLGKIYTEKIPGKNLYRYKMDFTTREEALRMLRAFKVNGFREAFIVK